MSEEQILNPRAENPDDAVPISETVEFTELSVTRCEENDGVDGGMIFDGDTRLERFNETEAFPQGPRGRVANRLVWRVQARDKALLGHSLVTTTHPYASDWYEVATFKRKTPTNLSTDELKNLRWKLLEKANGDPTVLKEHPYDLVETNPKILTAAFYVPLRFSEDLTTGRRSSASGDHAPPRRLWGLCADYDRARRRLELSSELDKLVRSAENGTLYFQFFSRRRIAKRGGGLADAPGAVALYPEVRDKASEVRDYAIAKALAGPRRGEEWRGRPVAELAATIFRAQFNNMNRRHKSAKFPRRTRHPRRAEGAADSALPPLEELAEKCEAQLRDIDAPDALSNLEEKAGDLLEAKDRDEQLIGLAIALALVRHRHLPRAIAARLRVMAADASDAGQRHEARTVLQAAIDLGLEKP